MKRSFFALLLLLLIIPTTGNASWWKRHRKPKPTVEAPAATEKDREEREREKRRKLIPAQAGRPDKKQMNVAPDVEGGDEIEEGATQAKPGPIRFGAAIESSLTKAAGRLFDVRSLPQTGPEKVERPEHEDPAVNRGSIGPANSFRQLGTEAVPVPAPNAPAPPPIANFPGLDFATFGNGHPPDTNGDVGPTYYIQSINTSLGIFRKSDGVRVSGVSFNTFMAAGAFGNLCDTNNFGDPIVLYDSFEDRWVITDFAFQLSGSAVVSPPGAFQCFAVSMTNDPVAGGWNFYSINTPAFLGDYPKLGVWTDGIYMTINSFANMAGGTFLGARAYAFNKAQMYAGAPSVQVVSFPIGGGDFTVLPSNARLQSGTPPPGMPNYFVSTWFYLNALTVYKFHVDWNNTTLSSFTGPDTPLSSTSWNNPPVGFGTAPSQGGNALDLLPFRTMSQNQYTKIGPDESLWITHTVPRAAATLFAAPRWYQVNVTGGTVADPILQATTWDPDGANVISRFMPSIAVDRAGDVALGYSTSSSTTKPAIKYAGRLAGDTIETFSQSEQVLIQGVGTQTGTCGGTCTRWGDYSAMSLDPDGCTFWYTNMYYAVDGLNHQTQIGSFSYPSCTPVGAGGTISGTVTAQSGGAPISGATLRLGTRSTTSNGSGVYTFSNVPAGSYTQLTASRSGFATGTISPVVVTDGGTTTDNFSLVGTPQSPCLTDTTRADFQVGTQNNTDVDTSVDNVLLVRPSGDASSFNVTGSGVGITITTWGGQTFTVLTSGNIIKADVRLFCSGCGGTTPNLTLSVKATTSNAPATSIPTGADLGSCTIPGFSSGSSVLYSCTFGTPVAVTAGTMYALAIRPTVNPSAGTYALSRSVNTTTGVGVDVYAGGARVQGATSGTVWSIPLSGGVSSDSYFAAYVDRGYAPTGNQISTPKDASAAPGLTPVWGNMTWNNTAPANTSVKFQVGASNNEVGPYSYVGPDGTNATFFTTSPASLAQFYNRRYLQYKAILSTADPNATPVLNDVSMCVTNLDCSGTASITPTPAAVCANSTGNTATGPAGAASYSWSITNGTITGGGATQTVTYDAGASGTVGLILNIIEAAGCHKSGSTNITINPIPAQPTISGGPTTFCAGGSVLLTSSSASGNQWYLNGNSIGGETNQTYTASLAGPYTVIVTINNCVSPTSAATNVTVNPLPPTPTNTPGGPTTFCAGGSVTLTSNAASGNQWYLNGNPIGGATNPTYGAPASGSYTVKVTDGNSCVSAASNAVAVTVNPIPATPTATPAGPTTFCTGGSVTINSNSASGNQWYLNGNPIGGATNASYSATASGSYTVIVTSLGCSSSASNAVSVTVNPIPTTPTATPAGPTTFCTGGSVTLNSNSASGNQWKLNGNPIGGATNASYSATASGNYTVVVTSLGCSSAASAPVAVTVNPNPNATITAAASVPSGSTGNIASVANAGVGATYAWTIGNGTITAGAGSNSITYTAGAVGTLTLSVTVTTSAGCADTKGANVTVTLPTVTVSSVTPNSGPFFGGKPVTIAGTGFLSGATVKFGGTSATNVVVVSGTQITAKTPAHAVGAVNVVVTNTNTASGTLTNGYTYKPQQFDPNGDNMVDPADIFYLVNYLFLHGPAPAGAIGMLSGDANGDGVVDPADIFFVVKYLFAGGPQPNATTPRTESESVSHLEGAVTLGEPTLRDGRWFVPVIVSAKPGSDAPQAISVSVRFAGRVGDAAVRGVGDRKPLFETSRSTDNTLSYLVAFGDEAPLDLTGKLSAVIAEIELSSASVLRLELDPALTMMTNSGGTDKATVAAGTLKISGTTVGGTPQRPHAPNHE
jgi:hypothetical protein